MTRVLLSSMHCNHVFGLESSGIYLQEFTMGAALPYFGLFIMILFSRVGVATGVEVGFRV
jgi:hypothetical protein